MKEVSEIPEYIRMYVVEGLVEQRKLRINHALKEYAKIKNWKISKIIRCISDGG
jgi:hypothetical protein